jgi:hypothetical protein
VLWVISLQVSRFPFLLLGSLNSQLARLPICGVLETAVVRTSSLWPFILTDGVSGGTGIDYECYRQSYCKAPTDWRLLGVAMGTDDTSSLLNVAAVFNMSKEVCVSKAP